MKSRIFTLMMAATVLCFSACGGGVGGHVQSPSEEWTWANGADVVNQRGTYGIEGTPAAANAPGARNNAISWTDKSGNLWLFGGFGYDASDNNTFLNDLWEYNAGEWAWMSGLSLGGEAGVRHVLRAVRNDFELTMRLAGHASLADLGPDSLQRRP